MSLNVGKEVAVLERMTVRELKERYAELFGEETRTHNRAWLFKRIAWRIQSMAEGDLSERAKARAIELARDADLRLSRLRCHRLAAAGRDASAGALHQPRYGRRQASPGRPLSPRVPLSARC